MPPAPHLEMGPRLAETWYLKECAKCCVLPGSRSHAGREGEEPHAHKDGWEAYGENDYRELE